jgi:hypothetical protein
MRVDGKLINNNPCTHRVYVEGTTTIGWSDRKQTNHGAWGYVSIFFLRSFAS